MNSNPATAFESFNRIDFYELVENINKITAQIGTIDFYEMWERIEGCFTNNTDLNKLALKCAKTVNDTGSELYETIVKGLYEPNKVLVIHRDGHVFSTDFDDTQGRSDPDEIIFECVDGSESLDCICRFYKGSDEAETWNGIWDKDRKLEFFLEIEDIYQYSKEDFALANSHVVITDAATGFAISAMG